MEIQYPPPSNESDFEKFCLRFYRVHWKRDGLIRYGKRGEKQHGIDIFDQLGRQPHQVIQCKFHELHKSITPSEIKAEVARAETASLPIDHYVIATTAKKSRVAQDTVFELNQRAVEKRAFTVEIHFWVTL